MPVTEARGLMLAQTAPLPVEQVPIALASGRVLAADVAARTTQPPYAASAMDGYALRHADIASPSATLTVIGEAPAGTPFAGTVTAGQAVRIFTGGLVPKGADTVVIQEDVTAEDGRVTVREAQTHGDNIRGAGIDFRQGDRLAAQGQVLDGLSLSLVASGNVAQVPVYRRPRIALLATGDELVPPGSALAPGQVVNSIAPGLAALCRDWGAEVVHIGHARDTEAAIQAELAEIRKADVAVMIGGASVGDYDLVKPALEAGGLVLTFSKTALKPGKPVWSGRLGATRILGLPGNPVSAFVCAHLFLKPLAFALTGRDGEAAVALVPARLDGALAANGPREGFMTASARLENGVLTVRPRRRQDSGLLSPLGRANCLINRPSRAEPLEDGAMVPILLTRPLA
jgi:molybdopterin molybdotransferase